MASRKKLLIIVIVLALGMVMTFTTLKQPSATGSIADSMNYGEGKIEFTIPNGENDWNIQIVGRVETKGMGGMSVHYLEKAKWEGGKSYSFDVSGGNYTELYLTADRNSEEISIDIMEYLPENLKAESIADSR